MDSKDSPGDRSSLQAEAGRLADAARERASGAFEEVKLASNQIVDKVRELIEDANVKRVIIKREGKVLLEIPLTVGVGAGAAALLMNPAIAAVGALAALVSDVTLLVEREDGTPVVGDASGSDAASSSSKKETSSGDDAPAADTDDKTVGRPPASGS